MSLWGHTIEAGEPFMFDCQKGELDLTGAVMTSGKECLIEASVDGKNEFILGRLTEARPNMRLNLIFEEDVVFSIAGDGKVQLLGNLRLPGDDCCVTGACSHEPFGMDMEGEGDAEMMEGGGSEEESDSEEVEPAVAPISKKTVPEPASKKRPASDVEAPAPKQQKGADGKKVQPQPKKPAKKPEAPKVEPVQAEPKKAAAKPVAEQKKAEPKKKAAPEPKKTPVKLDESSLGKQTALKNGVKFEVLKVGSGAVASVGKKVSVRYEGRLAKTSKKFDSGNLNFGIGSGDMIQGFDMGTRGMMVGETRKIFVPSRLGYGQQRVGSIPSNSDLIFEVTMKSVR